MKNGKAGGRMRDAGCKTRDSGCKTRDAGCGMRDGKEAEVDRSLLTSAPTKGQWPDGVVGLTKAQMAAALQISVRSLNGMMARQEIDYWQIGDRIVRFRLEDAVKRMNETVLVSADKRWNRRTEDRGQKTELVTTKDTKDTKGELRKTF